MRDPARYLSEPEIDAKKPIQSVERWDVYEFPRGYNILTGILCEDHHTNPRLVKGVRVYTSTVIREDLRGGIVETLNTVYKLVGPREPVR